MVLEGVIEEEPLRLAVILAVRVGVTELLGVFDDVMLDVGVTVAERVDVCDTDAPWLGERVPVPVPEAVIEAVLLGVIEGVPDFEGVLEGVCDGVPVFDGVVEGVPERLAVLLDVLEAVIVADGVILADRERVPVPLGVPLDDREAVRDCDDVILAVRVGDTVLEGVPVAVPD